MQTQSAEQPETTKRRAYTLILLFGGISLMGDLIYESGRSIFGPYLETLGASALIVGTVAGIGEFVGYGLRFAFGYFAQRTQRYWLLTILGYALIAAIPLAGWASAWETVAAFFVVERLGKALRTPARDTILSYATAPIGRGWGFALHEAIDQIGAILGPLALAWLLSTNATYSEGLRWTLLPFAFLLLLLLAARLHSPHPHRYEAPAASTPDRKYPPFFWWYLGFVFWCAVGFIPYPLIAYHAESTHLLSPSWIAGLYAIAMGIDSLSALLFGKLYDRYFLSLLWGIPVLTAAVALGAFQTAFLPLLLAACLWGMTMAFHETVLRAFVADTLSPQRRAFAYGLLNSLYGLGMLLGGALIGWLYNVNSALIFPLILLCQLLAISCWIMLQRAMRRQPRRIQS